MNGVAEIYATAPVGARPAPGTSGAECRLENEKRIKQDSGPVETFVFKLFQARTEGVQV